MTNPMQMPEYQCHKRVRALKIKRIDYGYRDADKGNPSWVCEIVPEDDNYPAIEVSAEYVKKHNPQAGGYYVVYENGYTSFSPADVFESGYTPCRDN
ncbi:hypothetical protein ACV8DN_003322 [Morganella morganii]|uniref:Uncharacterized protein n=1 Tax=Morganella morganii TaxID=582 RepID=A0AAU8ZMS0_MORMO|nr:hypothetical protein [Morganella morganii]AWC94565.1 hypothetical protein AM380_13475 [Morganella morganii]HAT3626044.1 hypothetical protein [Morganella morganii]HAT3766174.1 hypothetical protein [Morganella morganii]